VRPFNCYGPRQSGRAVIPTIAGQALHGSEVRIGSRTPTRDFTYVSDTVAGFMALAGAERAVGCTANIGSGREISVGALAERIVHLVGRSVPIVTTDERMRPEASEVTRLLSDSSLAERLAGWRPRVSLDEGLQHVVEFLRARPAWTRADRYEI
jgi:nucleoside-diphosphate-sugar epimerase